MWRARPAHLRRAAAGGLPFCLALLSESRPCFLTVTHRELDIVISALFTSVDTLYPHFACIGAQWKVELDNQAAFDCAPTSRGGKLRIRCL
jgi:hypothetical protein